MYNKPNSLLYLLEVAAQRVATLVRGGVVHNGGGLAGHRALLLLTLRARVLVLLAHRAILLALLAPVYVILKLYPHLTLCRLISGNQTTYHTLFIYTNLHDAYHKKIKLTLFVDVFHILITTPC